MNSALPQWLLAIAAALLLLNAVMHTRVFAETRSAALDSNLATFFGQSLQALWLIDAINLLALAVVFGVVAARPTMASGVVVALLALVSAGTAGDAVRLYRPQVSARPPVPACRGVGVCGWPPAHGRLRRLATSCGGAGANRCFARLTPTASPAPATPPPAAVQRAGDGGGVRG